MSLRTVLPKHVGPGLHVNMIKVTGFYVFEMRYFIGSCDSFFICFCKISLTCEMFRVYGGPFVNGANGVSTTTLNIKKK